MKKLAIILSICILPFSGMGMTDVLAVEQDQLVVFSGRKEPLIKPVIELFEATTGIQVVLKTGKSAALGQQIMQEMPNPSADVFIAKESGSLEYLRTQNVFEPYTSEETALIPDRYKAGDGSWIGVSGRSRAIIFNADKIDRAEVPTRLSQLTDPKYKGQIAAVNLSNESLVAWITALRLNSDDETVENLLNALKKNDIQLIGDSHTQIRKAVGRGEFSMGLINHYYYHLQQRETDEALRNVGIIYLDQGDGQRGELVNVSGVAIVKGSVHKESAQKFVDFLVSPEAQKLFAEVNFEYPLRDGVETHPAVLESLGCETVSAVSCINAMEVNLDQLGPEWSSTLDLLEDVDWR